jgi:hypothetical protein
MCVMEAVAWVAGEPHSDHPQCASPAIAAIMRLWNDRLPSDEAREKLKPFVAKLVGSRSTEEVEARRWKMVETFSRTVALPAALELAGLVKEAEAVKAEPTLENVRAARDAAWKLRRSKLDPLREQVRRKVEEAVKAKLAEKPAVAAAVAAAAAVADADADAVAAAAAAADAAADAAAAAGDPWGKTYRAVYDATKPVFAKAIADDPRFGAVAETMDRELFAFIDELLAVAA